MTSLRENGVLCLYGIFFYDQLQRKMLQTFLTAKTSEDRLIEKCVITPSSSRRSLTGWDFTGITIYELNTTQWKLLQIAIVLKLSYEKLIWKRSYCRLKFHFKLWHKKAQSENKVELSYFCNTPPFAISTITLIKNNSVNQLSSAWEEEEC